MIRLHLGGLPIDIAEERIKAAVDAQLTTMPSGGMVGVMRSMVKPILPPIMKFLSTAAEREGYPAWNPAGEHDTLNYSIRWFMGLLLSELARGEWILETRDTADGIEITGMAPAASVASGIVTGTASAPAIPAPDVQPPAAGVPGGPLGDPGHDGQWQDDVRKTLSA